MLSDNVNRHLLKYWERCRALFAGGDYPLAAFCAVTLIEELGKVPMLSLRAPEEKLRDLGFFDHHEKYVSAVWATLYVNSRVSRIYGEREAKFARWFREGNLFKIRNSALYMSQEGESIVTPETAVSQEDCFLLICIAGEALAEIQGNMTGTGPTEWERLLEEVDEFRQRFDIQSPNKAKEDE